ncbi:DUF2071 domain-containing protein [bacterium SCSIO 12741]|nr:DUF2071 domain-containing protein [bacterium SCSIO 12741]
MLIKDLLQQYDHRPWPLPKTSWKYYQEWNNALFLHWPVPQEELIKWLPSELEMDLFEGQPWVSLVAFTMEKIRPSNLPAFPPISNFDEINVRTYVRFKGKSGVHFLSIEGGKSLSCKLAKALSELPYRYSKMTRKTNHFQSHNPAFSDRFSMEYRTGPLVKVKSNLDRWLTERYALFQDSPKGINAFEIHHVEWPIHSIEIKKSTINYPRFGSLLTDLPVLSHYSPGVQVIAWDKTQHPLLTPKK